MADNLAAVRPSRQKPLRIKKSLRIAVDVDDVLARSAQAFVEHSNERWGTNLTVDDYHENWESLWDLDSRVPSELDEIMSRVNDYYDSRFGTLLRHDFARDVLDELKNDHEVMVVTARRITQKDKTIDWLNEHFTDVFLDDNIHFAGLWDTTDRRHALNKTKADFLETLGADVLIDDQPKHCNGAAERGMAALLFGDYAWQRGVELHDNVIKVKNWREVATYFKRLSGDFSTVVDIEPVEPTKPEREAVAV